MERYGTLVLWLSLTALARAQQVAPVQPFPREHDHAVRVRLYNYAQVPSSMLAWAQSEVTRIFKEARIQIVWLDSARIKPGSEAPPDSFQPLDSRDIALRILTPEMENYFAVRKTALGFAILSAEDGTGSIANVCYDRVAGLAAGPDPPLHHVLALVFAHEIGHLLLPMSGHSRSGIMRALWTQDDLAMARSPSMLFTAEQSQLMRDSLGSTSKRMGDQR